MKFSELHERLLTEMPHAASEETAPFKHVVDFRLETFGKDITYDQMVERLSSTIRDILNETKQHMFVQALLTKFGKSEDELMMDIKDRIGK